VSAITQAKIADTVRSCKEALVRELKSADAEGLATTWAFVVMPDHCHWLMPPHPVLRPPL